MSAFAEAKSLVADQLAWWAWRLDFAAKRLDPGRLVRQGSIGMQTPGVVTRIGDGRVEILLDHDNPYAQPGRRAWLLALGPERSRTAASGCPR